MLIACCHLSNAQCINWNSYQDNQKLACSLYGGLDYGLVIGGNISYKFYLNKKQDKKIPLITMLDYSFPSGKNVLDDFKIKFGIQSKVALHKNLILSVKLQPIYRQHLNAYITAMNLGSDFSLCLGYYKPKWLIGAEIGIDNALITKFKSSNLYKEIVPSVPDQWLQLGTAGNFYYGLQTAFSTKQMDYTLKIGKVIEQDFKSKPLIPYYMQLGVNLRLY